LALGRSTTPTCSGCGLASPSSFIKRSVMWTTRLVPARLSLLRVRTFFFSAAGTFFCVIPRTVGGAFPQAHNCVILFLFFFRAFILFLISDRCFFEVMHGIFLLSVGFFFTSVDTSPSFSPLLARYFGFRTLWRPNRASVPLGHSFSSRPGFFFFSSLIILIFSRFHQGAAFPLRFLPHQRLRPFLHSPATFRFPPPFSTFLEKRFWVSRKGTSLTLRLDFHLFPPQASRWPLILFYLIFFFFF